MSSYVQSNQVIQLVAAGAVAIYTVSEADSGKIFLIPVLGAAHGLTINLPAVKAGLRYKFIAQGTLASAAIITPTAIQLINGVLIVLNTTIANSVLAKNAVDSVQLTATAVIGDWIEIYSDGTKWYVSGVSQVAAGLA